MPEITLTAEKGKEISDELSCLEQEPERDIYEHEPPYFHGGGVYEEECENANFDAMEEARNKWAKDLPDRFKKGEN